MSDAAQAADGAAHDLSCRGNADFTCDLCIKIYHFCHSCQPSMHSCQGKRQHPVPALSASDGAWLSVPPSRAAAASVQSRATLRVLQIASQWSRRQILAVAMCWMVNVLAFLQSSSDAAPSFAESIRSAEGFTIRQNPFSGSSQKTEPLHIAACSASWQGIRIGTGSRGQCSCPAPTQHLLYFMGILSVFVTQNEKWDLENCWKPFLQY